jgi:hypothetical protein
MGDVTDKIHVIKLVLPRAALAATLGTIECF